MPKVRFGGRIFPFEIKVSIQDHPQINWKDTENDLDITFAITIQNSTVTVDCEVNRFEQSLITPLYMRAFDLARATVDLVAFSSGYGFTVIFDNFTSPTGETTPFGPHMPSLAGICTVFKLGEQSATLEENNFHRVLSIVSTDWKVFRSLRDLVEAITLPHESAVNCARAIEGLRNIIAPSSTERSHAWKAMRDTLNVSEQYLKLITDVSTGPRHGDHGRISGATTTEIVRRSWIIMNRFLEYKKRGTQRLPLADFPLLAV
jgi:hypothetical protein